MTENQHPLTDDTRDRLAEHIAGGTLDCSGRPGRYDSLTQADARVIVESLWEPMIRTLAVDSRPAETTDEVGWKPQFGDVITNVETAGLRFPQMIFDGVWWCSEGESKGSGALTAATLPDGTRVRRDGNYEDGTPRFVKVQKEEK